MSEAEEARVSRGDALRRQAVSGAMWTVATSVVARVLGVVGTLAITHFLDPEDYGEVSIAAVVIMTAHAVSTFGLGQFLVSKPKAGRAAAFHVTFYFMLLGGLAMGAAVLLARPIGAFFDAPGLARYVPGLALAAMLERAAILQDRIQLRDMRFRSVGLQRSLGEIVYSGASLGLAAAGWGAGALVWASIARSVVRAVTLALTTPRREWLEPCAITWARTRELFAFGLPMSIAGLAAFGARKWDNFIFARHFGAKASGFYNLAYNLADIPATQIGETIGDVLVPSFAKMESEEQRRRALLASTRILILLVAPMAVGLAAIAPTLVHTLFPPSYARIAGYLVILAALSVVRPIGWIGSSYLQVKNLPRAIMVLEIVKAVALAALMYAAAWRTGSALLTCAAVGIAFALNSFGYMVVFARVDGLSLRSQLLPLLPPLLACGPMALAVFAARLGLARIAHVPRPAALAIETLAGAVAFIPAALVIAPAASRDLLRLIRAARERRRAPDEPRAAA